MRWLRGGPALCAAAIAMIAWVGGGGGRRSKFQVLTIVLIIVLTFVLTIDHSADHSADYGAGHSDCHGVDHCVDQGVDPAIETTVTLLSLLGQRRTPRGSASLELALCANFEH